MPMLYRQRNFFTRNIMITLFVLANFDQSIFVFTFVFGSAKKRRVSADW